MTDKIATGAFLLIATLFTSVPPNECNQISPDREKLSFEIATVKPAIGDASDMSIQVAGSDFHVYHETLRDMIKFAYHLKLDVQLIGTPGWMSARRFDVHAKVDTGYAQAFARLPPDQMMEPFRLMVQSLLADRFELKLDSRVEQMPVYVLTVAKGGAKLKAAAPAADRRTWLAFKGKAQLSGTYVSMAMLADSLARQPEIGNRPVIDETGLTGKYDFVLNGVAVPGSNEPPSASLFTLIQEQLGLVLRAQKAPVKIFSVAHAETASEN